MSQRILKIAAAVLVWLIVCGLGLVILGLGRDLFLLFIVNTLHANRWSLTAWTNLYVVVAGLMWMGLFLLMEHKLSQAVNKSKLLPLSLYSIGLSVLIMSLVQFGLTLYGRLPGTALQVGLTVLELLIGAGLMYLSRRKKPQFAS